MIVNIINELLFKEIKQINNKNIDLTKYNFQYINENIYENDYKNDYKINIYYLYSNKLFEIMKINQIYCKNYILNIENNILIETNNENTEIIKHYFTKYGDSFFFIIYKQIDYKFNRYKDKYINGNKYHYVNNELIKISQKINLKWFYMFDFIYLYNYIYINKYKYYKFRWEKNSISMYKLIFL